jgi:hypothetical protein
VIARRSNRRVNAARVEELCRKLDVSEFRAFLQEKEPIRYARIRNITDRQALAAMHKVRCYEPHFTPEEKAFSRGWLQDHGFTEAIDTTELQRSRRKAASPAAGASILDPILAVP